MNHIGLSSSVSIDERGMIVGIQIPEIFEFVGPFLIEPTNEKFTVSAEECLSLFERRGVRVELSDAVILKDFRDVSIPGRTEEVGGAGFKIFQDLKHDTIRKSAIGAGIYREYNFFDALALIVKLILCGYLDTPGIGVMVYLEEKPGGWVHRIYVRRCASRNLILDIGEVLNSGLCEKDTIFIF